MSDHRRNRLLRTASWIVVLPAVFLQAGCGDAAPSLPTAPNASVLLISLDTTRADRLGCYGHAAARTPHLDRLAADGALFEQCTTSAPITLTSHASVFTGLQPYAHGVRLNGSYRLGPEHTTLAESLATAGRRTHAQVAAMVLNAGYGLSQGFESYNDLSERPAADGDDAQVELRASAVSDEAVRWLRDVGGAPFFLFLHYFDPHYPYAAPKEFADAISDPYDAEIAYADQQVGRVLAALRELGREADTLVIVFADHGEGLGEHSEPTHGSFLYDTTLQVPLLMRLPGVIPPGRRIAAQSRLIDVAPTVLGLLGLPPLPNAHGIDLRPMLVGDTADMRLAAYSENHYPRLWLGFSSLRSWRADGWKYIHAPRSELYNVLADPAESTDLFGREGQRAASMADGLKRALADARAPSGSSAGGVDLEKLEALGYAGSTSAGEDADLDAFEPSGESPMDHPEELEVNARAIMALSTGDFAAAEPALRDAIARGPRSDTAIAWANSRLGRVLAATGRPEESLPYFRAALAARPEDTSERARLGVALLYASQFAEARDELEKSLTQRPSAAQLYVYAAVANAGAGDLTKARQWLDKAAQLMPDLSRLYEAEAATFAPTDAAPTSATSSAPVASPPELQLAALAASLGLHAASIEPLRIWLTENSQDAIPTAMLGEAYASAGRWDDAVQSLSRATELSPGMARAWDFLGVALRAQGDLPGAVRALRRGVELAPENPSLSNELAWILATAPDDALRDGVEAVRLAELANRATGGETPTVLDTYAAALAEAGQFDQAVRVARQAIDLAGSAGQTDLAKRVTARLRGYEQRQPFREPAPDPADTP